MRRRQCTQLAGDYIDCNSCKMKTKWKLHLCIWSNEKVVNHLCTWDNEKIVNLSDTVYGLQIQSLCWLITRRRCVVALYVCVARATLARRTTTHVTSDAVLRPLSTGTASLLTGQGLIISDFINCLKFCFKWLSSLFNMSPENFLEMILYYQYVVW